jgi:hypothetical protein
MKYFSILLLFFCSFQNTIGNVEKLDKEYGFRNHSFGTLISAFKNLVFTGGIGEVKNFENRADDLSFGDYKANKISYFFYKNKFYRYVIEIKGIENRKGILAWFQSQYGPGALKNAKTNRYVWMGKEVIADYVETPTGAIIEVSSKQYEDLIESGKDRAE